MNNNYKKNPSRFVLVNLTEDQIDALPRSTKVIPNKGAYDLNEHARMKLDFQKFVDSCDAPRLAKLISLSLERVGLSFTLDTEGEVISCQDFTDTAQIGMFENVFKIIRSRINNDTSSVPVKSDSVTDVAIKQTEGKKV